MNKFVIGTIAIASAVLPAFSQDAEQKPDASKAVAAVVAESEAKVEASAAAVAEDAQIAIDADEKVQEAFDRFLTEKTGKDSSTTAYGSPNARGQIYYAEMEAVTSGSAADPDFLKKRQMAYARAFQQVRNNYVKYSFKSFLTTGEKGSFLYDSDAMKKQAPKDDAGALKRLGEKIVALSEAKVDKALEEAGVDPSKYASLPAKRKMLSRSIIRDAVVHSVGTCTGISVVKTVEGQGTDGTYTIGVIARYDPEAVVIADCIARKTRPSILPKQGLAVGELLKGNLAENFGTRLYYDESGMPALLSFGQWSSNVTPGTDRYERKLLEKAAFQQAEAQANIDMSNFIAGHMTYDELSKAGERYDVNVVYSDDGIPVGRDKESEIDDLVDWNSSTTARDGMAGRSRVFAKTMKHPDTSAMITVVAVNWSFAKLDQLVRDSELRKPKPAMAAEPAEKPAKTGKATLREGDSYDF